MQLPVAKFGVLLSIYVYVGMCAARSLTEITIDNKEYKLERLSEADQGMSGGAHRFVDGFGPEGTPAILKILSAQERYSNERAKREVAILRKPEINQLLTLKKEDTMSKGVYTWYLVIRDISTNYPKKGAPTLAPLYDVLARHPKMDVKDSAARVRKMARARADEMTKKPVEIAYLDARWAHIWTDDDLSVVYFIDYDRVLDVSKDGLAFLKQHGNSDSGYSSGDDDDDDTNLNNNGDDKNGNQNQNGDDKDQNGGQKQNGDDDEYESDDDEEDPNLAALAAKKIKTKVDAVNFMHEHWDDKKILSLDSLQRGIERAKKEIEAKGKGKEGGKEGKGGKARRRV